MLPSGWTFFSVLYFRIRRRLSLYLHIWNNSHAPWMPAYRLREISKCILHLLLWQVAAFFPSNLCAWYFLCCKCSKVLQTRILAGIKIRSSCVQTGVTMGEVYPIVPETMWQNAILLKSPSPFPPTCEWMYSFLPEMTPLKTLLVVQRVAWSLRLGATASARACRISPQGVCIFFSLPQCKFGITEGLTWVERFRAEILALISNALRKWKKWCFYVQWIISCWFNCTGRPLGTWTEFRGQHLRRVLPHLSRRRTSGTLKG